MIFPARQGPFITLFAGSLGRNGNYLVLCWQSIRFARGIFRVFRFSSVRGLMRQK